MDFYGFKSLKTAPLIDLLYGFENDLLGIINGIYFHKNKNNFQRRLDYIVKEIR